MPALREAVHAGSKKPAVLLEGLFPKRCPWSRDQETSLQAVRRRELADWLFTIYFATAKPERLELLKRWLDLARSGETTTADVLRNPVAFTHPHADVLARPATYGAAIALPHAAQRFCQRFLGCHAGEWVSGRTTVAETGEMKDTVITQSAPLYMRTPRRR